ncbi:YheV family putative zinc ribbon protein [Vibrio breoganii]|uniref:Metal-binding protein n=1 Tax=Vibrio breoganii TaxID=553239 RepID=A0AAP8MXR2_9VIBR|nr:YheV family putative zinc ribbon protein [Vibrio breoganii]NMO75309.1 YheV family putative metal-binding protein [Vibrio breoganii]NMR71850.1 YheV family putative metal-binding protein [Vibrio breoganii]OED94848.1 metal-binding protein [Vibrio breoganii ZF-29]OEF83540.1 metal-binding protein [Vibrio breoganii 1C10]PMF82639.1 metal-binding protein [Vibrio breoganii]
MKIKKRFIAGAACPECSDTDSLRWWEENNVEWVECVSCDFKEQRLPADQQEQVGQQDLIGIFKPE